MAQSWRDNLKSGPLGSLYRVARNLKRLARKEPLAGPVPIPQTQLSMAELLSAAPYFASHGRFYYSLALDYLGVESSSPIAESPAVDLEAYRRALACLRCAEALKFESPERIALYKAWIYARCGDAERAVHLAARFDHSDLQEERPLLRSIESRAVTPLGQSAEDSSEWDTLYSKLQRRAPQSLVVFGDPEARTSDWLPDITYVLVEPQVTGLDVKSAVDLGIEFEIACGPAALLSEAREAGLICREWVVSPA